MTDINPPAAAPLEGVEPDEIANGLEKLQEFGEVVRGAGHFGWGNVYLAAANLIRRMDAQHAAALAAARREGERAGIERVIRYLTGVADRCEMLGERETYNNRSKYIRSLIDPHIRALAPSPDAQEPAR